VSIGYGVTLTLALRLAVLIVAILCTASTLAAQPKRGSPLGPEERYTWSIRASHTDDILLAVGDSLDVVLLRDRCGADAGQGQKGCWDASTIQVKPKWTVSKSGVARVHALATGSWLFGPGTAGARIYGVGPGAATVVASLQARGPFGTHSGSSRRRAPYALYSNRNRCRSWRATRFAFASRPVTRQTTSSPCYHFRGIGTWSVHVIASVTRRSPSSRGKPAAYWWRGSATSLTRWSFTSCRDANDSLLMLCA
jgi:hypothetical protein